MAFYKGLLPLFMIGVLQFLALASPALPVLMHTTNYLVSRAQTTESTPAVGEGPDVFASTLTPPPTTILASATISVYTSLSFIIVPQLAQLLFWHCHPSRKTIPCEDRGSAKANFSTNRPSVYIASPPVTGTSITPSVVIISPVSRSITAFKTSLSTARTSTPTTVAAALKTESSDLSPVIGGSIGAGVVILILILIICLRRHHQRKDKIARERSLGSGNLDSSKNYNEPLHQRVISWVHKTPSTPEGRMSIGLRRGNSVTASCLPSHSYTETLSEYYSRSPNLYITQPTSIPARSASNNSMAIKPGSVHKFPSFDEARVAYTPPTRPIRPVSLTPSVIEIMDAALSGHEENHDILGPLEPVRIRHSGATGTRIPPPIGAYRHLHVPLTDEERHQVPIQPYHPGHQRNFTEPTIPPQGAFSDRSITPEPLRIVKRSVSEARVYHGSKQPSFKIEDFAGLYENGKQRFNDPDESDEEKKAKLREEAFNTLEGNPPPRRQIASSIYSRTVSGASGWNQGGSSKHAERVIHEERAKHKCHNSEEIRRAKKPANIKDDLRPQLAEAKKPDNGENLHDL
ncbi:hypothetical protein BGZ60DRAFT_427994 [Tricladium varicosporioides]|nr:hypothetical protein BGZ60DRAFT_427994 [Hymenoscyphus varicosporioides]